MPKPSSSHGVIGMVKVAVPIPASVGRSPVSRLIGAPAARP
jgi:hypothetical protein